MKIKESSGDRGLPSSKARPGDAGHLNPKARLRHVAASHLGGGITAPLRCAAASAWRDDPLPGRAAATCSWRAEPTCSGVDPATGRYSPDALPTQFLLC